MTSDTGRSLSAVVKQYYRHIDNQDIPAALSCFTPDAVYRRPGYEALLGLAAISRFYHDNRVISGGRHELDAVIEQNDMVAVHGSFEGTLRSGAPARIRFADFWCFSGLLVAKRDTYFDVAAL